MATIYDVAKLARVTAATVSNVITGKGAVGAETRARVEAAITELDYKPNILARSLVTRQTYTLGLMLPDIANPFYPEIALEVEHTARRHGYSLFLCNTCNDEHLGRTYLQQLTGRQVDGVIVMPGGVGLDDLAGAMRGGLPIVLCNWEEQDELPALPGVGVDFFQAGSLAARHLLALGHRRIGLVADAAVPHTRHTERVAGFAATLEAAGLAWEPGLLALGDSTMASGERATRELCRLADPPSALFCTNDLMALGAREAAQSLGLRVPGDLSVLGLDDIAIGAHSHPRLTTVAIPKRQIAAQATSLLLGWIGRGAAPDPAPVGIPAHLVVRDSTGSVGEPIAGGEVALPDGPSSTAGARLSRYRHLLDAPSGG